MKVLQHYARRQWPVLYNSEKCDADPTHLLKLLQDDLCIGGREVSGEEWAQQVPKCGGGRYSGNKFCGLVLCPLPNSFNHEV